jgi:hypothetical protein
MLICKSAKSPFECPDEGGFDETAQGIAECAGDRFMILFEHQLDVPGVTLVRRDRAGPGAGHALLVRARRVRRPPADQGGDDSEQEAEAPHQAEIGA